MEIEVIRSMTGYARALAGGEACTAEVEIRSVNNRYQDLRVRLPASLVPHEIEVRRRVAARIGRGKVDVAVHLALKGESASRLDVDRALLGEVVRTARSVGEELGLPGDVRISDLLSFGRGFTVNDSDVCETVGVQEAVWGALEQALGDHERMRSAEGAELGADLERRMQSIARLLDAVEEISASTRERRRRDLVEKVRELELTGLEPSVLAMEIARLVERSDVSEEITRFRSHLLLWRDAVASAEPCGKKLDFIVQEMNREVNTIGSKGQDAALAGHVIAIKSELERVREQIQNIE